MIVQQLVVILVFSQEGVRARPSTLPSWFFSPLTVIFKLVIGGLPSIILIVLSTVNLQLQGWFVSISLGQFSELWQLMSWLQSGHHAVNFFHPVGVSVSIRQLTGHGSEYYL